MSLSYSYTIQPYFVQRPIREKELSVCNTNPILKRIKQRKHEEKLCVLQLYNYMYIWSSKQLHKDNGSIRIYSVDEIAMLRPSEW